MELLEARDKMASYSDRQKVVVCAMLCHQLTVLGRVVADAKEGMVSHRTRLMQVNELLHHLTGHLVRALKQGSDAALDEAIVNMFFSRRHDPYLEVLLQQTISHVLESLP